MIAYLYNRKQQPVIEVSNYLGRRIEEHCTLPVVRSCVGGLHEIYDARRGTTRIFKCAECDEQIALLVEV